MQTAALNHVRSFDDLRELVAEEFQQVNSLIYRQLSSQVQLIEDIEHYIVDSGGKRLRPLVALLAARACGYRHGDHHLLLAVIVEFLHTATLLHDDVIDKSSLRRGRKTVNRIWGDKASILVGDFLFSRAFQLMVKFNHAHAMQLLADTTNIIAEGEVMQLISVNQAEMDEDHYWQVIYAKTAKLFSTTTELAALLSGKDAKTQQRLAEFGRHLGIAFQLVDDVLDYRAKASDMGKNPGDDLAEGKPTLPIIHAIAHAPTPEANFMKRALQAGDIAALAEIQAIMQRTNSLDYCLELAEQRSLQARQALTVLPNTEYLQALAAVPDLILKRSS